MKHLPPGPRLLLALCPKLLLPPAIGYSLLRLVPNQLSHGLQLLACLLAIPVYFLARIIVTEIFQRREAKTMGARLVPRVKGKLPGNIDILFSAIRSWLDGHIEDLWFDFADQYGLTYNVRILWEDRIITLEPNNIKTILASDFPNYIKGAKLMRALDSFLGTGVLNSDGEMWKFHRSMTRPYFSRDRITDFDIFSRHADKAIEKAKERMQHGFAIDIQDLTSRFTLDSATEFLLGDCVDTLSAPLPDPSNVTSSHPPTNVHPSDEFARALQEAQTIASTRVLIGPLWGLNEFWKDRTKKSMDVINGLCDPIIKKAMSKPHGEKEHSEPQTLLEHMVQVTDDVKTIRDELVNMLTAGRDTTASLLTFAIYSLAMHPEVMARLRTEVLASLGPNKAPTSEDIKGMKYLRAVINETLRVHSPVPSNIRETVNATSWDNKEGGRWYIPARTSTIYFPILMHRRKEVWGEDALKFDPDRFLDDRKQVLIENPFSFLPFNGGPRICLGQQFAYNEASVFLVRFLQNFDTVSLAPDAHPPNSLPPKSWSQAKGRKAFERYRPRSHLTLYSVGGLWVTLSEAQSED